MDLKVKDFAAAQGVTDSIIYRHIRAHKEDLGENVYKQGKSTWLTDAGQAYIKDLMIKQPYALSDIGINLKVHELQQELDLAQKTIINVQGQLTAQLVKNTALAEKAAQTTLLIGQNAEKDKKIADLQAKSVAQTAKIAEISALSAEKDKSIQELKKELEKRSSEAEDARLEVEFYKKLNWLDKLLNKKYEKQG